MPSPGKATFKKFIFTDSMKSVELIDTIGAGNYGVFGTAVETIATASEDLFRDAYEIEFGDVPLLPFTGNAYDATFLMALAIQKAGSTDRTAIRDALRSVAGGGGLPIMPGEWTKAVAALSAGQHINYQGAAGSQDFDANGDVPGTIGLIGALASNVSISVATSVSAVEGVVQITGASTSPMITNLADNDFLFRTTPHTVIQGQVLGALLRERGYERLAILYVDDDYGTGLANAIQETFGLLGGVITAQIAFEPSRPSYRDVVQVARVAGRDRRGHCRQYDRAGR